MQRPARLLYIDWLRGLALLLMMQWHAFNSWLREDLRSSDLYQLAALAGGLPAALFLFLTGISLVILLERGQPDELRRIVLKRSGYILMVALLFRLQQWAFYWPHAPASGLFKVDILNTMGVALAVAGALTLLVEPRLRMVAAALGALAAAMATPLTWAIPRGAMPAFLLDYLQGSPQMDLKKEPL